MQSVPVDDVLIRFAVPADTGALNDVFRRSSLSNEGDRANLLAHPDALAISKLAVHEQRTRVAIADGRIVIPRVAEKLSISRETLATWINQVDREALGR